ncbi:MAG: DUF1838 domain-containing protein [Alphaproteobacteria bacterium]|nr:DUF1838 domain-containing protein [Alphaproteobacteria bacterium]
MLKGLVAGFAALAFTASAAAQAPSVSEPFTQEVFQTWIDARAGTGAPAYWYSVGTVRDYPSGEVLYIMEGYDASTAYWPEGREGAVAHQYNRKIYIFRDPETGEVVPESVPVAYPYQFITYTLADGAIDTVVEQGSGDRIQSIEGDGMSYRALGDTHVFTAPVFIDFPIPGTDRRIQAWENYDFFIHPDGAVDEPHQLSWARVGQLPPWAGGGQAVMHLITWRIDDYAQVPESLRTYIEAEAPLWMNPPADLDEIRALQAGE